MRKIIVDGKVYEWRVGRNNIVIRINGISTTIKACEVIGVTPSIYERGQYKMTQDGMVTPSLVAAYIRTHYPI